MSLYWSQGPAELHLGHVCELLRARPADSVHCVVTSPPYWKLRDYGVPPSTWSDGWVGCLGLEPTPELYVAHIVEVFEEIRRVLRPDGTLWLNIGDSYTSGGCGSRNPGRWPKQSRNDHMPVHGKRASDIGLKPKDIVGIPWMLAFALRAAGWYLRSEIIWHKRSPMPESVRDRPTKAHEQFFLLSKSPRYFYDHIAIAEPIANTEDNTEEDLSRAFSRRRTASPEQRQDIIAVRSGNKERTYRVDKGGVADSPAAHRAMGIPWENRDNLRNRRSVWSVASAPLKEAHFATYPPKLIEPCILAGTSEAGCCSSCGAPLHRITRRRFIPQSDVSGERGLRSADGQKAMAKVPQEGRSNWEEYPRGVTGTRTIGWAPACKCQSVSWIPCTVLDPFSGSSTTGVVALAHGRRYVGLDVKEEYLDIGRRRLEPLLRQGDLFRWGRSA
jgi:DNA modification methylase